MGSYHRTGASRRSLRARLGSRPAIATGLSLAALTLGVVPAMQIVHASSYNTTLKVPCSATALDAEANTANATTGKVTLDLAKHCLYAFTTPDAVSTNDALPALVNPQLYIEGNGSTIERYTTATTDTDFRLIEVGTGGNVHIDKLTISNGLLAAATQGFGAGVLVDSGAFVDLDNSTVIANNVTGATGTVEGAGIEVATGGTATVGNSSQVNLNSATASGTAIAQGGGIANHGNLVVADSRVSYNFAKTAGTTAMGGGILNDDASATLVNDLVVNNVASSSAAGDALGGGIADEDAVAALLSVDDSSVNQNNASVTSTATNAGLAQGGGVWVGDGASLSFRQSKLDDNTATAIAATGTTPANTPVANGGGLYNDGNVTLFYGSVVKSSIEDNLASAPTGLAEGGGVFNDTAGTLSVVKTEVTDNKATTGATGTATGGGIYNVSTVVITTPPAPPNVDLITTKVLHNAPDQCGVPSTVLGC